MRRRGSDPPQSDFAPSRSDWTALALLLSCLVALFWKYVFTSEMPFHRDISAFNYPQARFVQELCRRGELPYWNPYLYFGHPLLANPQNLFFYPSTLLILLLPLNFAYKFHYLAHFALMASGAYVLARRWQQSVLAASFCALIFLLSGPVLSLGNFYNHVACAAWIPWALLLTDIALHHTARGIAVESSSRRPWILLTLVLALQFLAGEPLTFLATFSLCFALALHRLGSLSRPLAPPALRLLARFILVGLLLLGLSAVQLLPSLSLLQFSRRGQGLPFQEVIEWSLHPLSLLELLIPEFFGPLWGQGSVWKDLVDWRIGSYFLSLFLGGVPLFFALAGWTLGHNSRRRFVWASTLLLFLLALGVFTPVFALAFLLLPPLGMVRYPIKLLVPLVLLLALSAGWGLDALRAPPQQWIARRRRLLAPLAGFVAAMALLWTLAWISPPLIARPAQWLMHRTDRILTWPASPILTPDQVAEGLQYLITMLRWTLPVLASYGLGGLCLVLAVKGRSALPAIRLRSRFDVAHRPELAEGWPRVRRPTDRGAQAGWAPKAVIVFAALGLLQLVLANSQLNPTIPPDFYTSRSPVVSYLPHSEEMYRFHCGWRSSSFYRDSMLQAAGLPLQAQIAFRDKLILVRGAMLDGVETGGDADIDGSAPEVYYEYCLFHGRAELTNKPEADCLLGRANVLYELERPQTSNPLLRPVAEIFNGSPEPSILYQNLCALPRAFVAAQALPSPSDRETLLRLAAPDFPALHVVFISGLPTPRLRQASLPTVASAKVGLPAGASAKVGLPADGGPDEGLESPGRVQIVDRQPNHVTLRADLHRPAFVVLLDRFDPNWHAALDAREVPILRADLLFRAVRVPEGQHELRFTYHQQGLIAGIVLSALTLLLLAILYWMDSGGP